MMKTAVEMEAVITLRHLLWLAGWGRSGPQEGLTCDLDDDLGMLFLHKAAFEILCAL